MSFLKLNVDFTVASLEIKMDMVNILIKKLQQDKVLYFRLFAQLAKDKNKDTSRPRQPKDPDDALQ